MPSVRRAQHNPLLCLVDATTRFCVHNPRYIFPIFLSSIFLFLRIIIYTFIVHWTFWHHDAGSLPPSSIQFGVIIASWGRQKRANIAAPPSWPPRWVWWGMWDGLPWSVCEEPLGPALKRMRHIFSKQTTRNMMIYCVWCSSSSSIVSVRCSSRERLVTLADTSSFHNHPLPLPPNVWIHKHIGR